MSACLARAGQKLQMYVRLLGAGRTEVAHVCRGQKLQMYVRLLGAGRAEVANVCPPAWRGQGKSCKCMSACLARAGQKLQMYVLALRVRIAEA